MPWAVEEERRSSREWGLGGVWVPGTGALGSGTRRVMLGWGGQIMAWGVEGEEDEDGTGRRTGGFRKFLNLRDGSTAPLHAYRGD